MKSHKKLIRSYSRTQKKTLRNWNSNFERFLKMVIRKLESNMS